MRSRKSRPIRNKVDLTDRAQVRLLKKRLQLSEAELIQIVDKSGNSIAAIAKEAALQRAKDVAEPAHVPAAVIASGTLSESSVSEPQVRAEPNS
jgi:chorismate mutase